MSDPIRPALLPASTANTGQFFTTLAAILVAIVVLLVLDTALARIDSSESVAHAESLYADGREQLVGHRPRVAVERFAAAFALERTSVRYQLALGEALLEDGRLGEAEATLTAALSRAGTDGSANLAMARVLRREGRLDEAKSYYHRAIYGRWDADSVRARTGARLELISVLAAGTGRRELLAELLPFEDAIPDSVPLRRRVANLFIQAGSPARSIGLFRSLLKQDPGDADAYAGMGAAALALGEFGPARADFAHASQLSPGDRGIVARVALADTILTLDPTARGLDVHARYARARALLARTDALAQSCTVTTARQAVADSAQRALLAVPAPRNESAASEQLLALAVDLYAVLASRCTSADRPADEVLALLQPHLRQERQGR